MSKTELQKRAIIKQLYFGGTISCAEISDRTEKSITLTAKLLNELVESGVVQEKGLAPSTGGRRPATYSLKPDVLYILSVAMDQYVTRFVIMDMQNEFVTDTKNLQLPLKNNPQALQTLIYEIEQFIAESGIPKEKIAGIGIGMPGFVDVNKGVNYSFLQAGGKNLKMLISEQVGLPVFIDNDSSLIALAELRFGTARDKTNVMVINFGWGVGLGLILHKQIFRGYNGFAGEFSHIPLFQNGKLCSCGKTGCLETETSLLVIIEKAKEGICKGRTSALQIEGLDNVEQANEVLSQAAQNGDQFAVELFSETAYNIGRGVAILIHLLNPEIIVLSGRGSTAGFVLQAPIQRALNDHCIPRLAASTTIELSNLGHEAELIGAACLVMEQIDKIGIRSSTKRSLDPIIRK
ncbi:MAG: ROK family protein [Bacteroidota bacterium]|nr:ROK family protein [Bacteroidota bacterium]